MNDQLKALIAQSGYTPDALKAEVLDNIRAAGIKLADYKKAEQQQIVISYAAGILTGDAE